MEIDDIIKKVENILTKCKVFSAPIPIVSIAEEYGFIVIESNLKESGFMLIDEDGVNVNGEKHQKVICINAKDSPLRKRFTIAHELGHFFLEVEGQTEAKRYFVHREFRDENFDAKKERAADLFASELLIPNGLLKQEMDKIQDDIEIFYLSIPQLISDFFKVSLQCAEIRYERYRRGENEG